MQDFDTFTSALEAFATCEPVLIALDFDGTLAPLVDDPEDSRMLPEAEEALLGLTALPGVSVALVSGRAIDSLLRVANPCDEWFLVGSHGGEIVAAGHHLDYVAPSLVPQELDHAFMNVVAAHPGTRLERKAFGLALHTRGVKPELASHAEHEARALCEKWDDALSIRVGHGILECSVLQATKADGIRELRRMTGAEATLFAGDDVTDEDALAVLSGRDIGIRVGFGNSVADFRVADASEMARTLQSLFALIAADRG
jgi:trehalose 6-phosphate phosphatase